MQGDKWVTRTIDMTDPALEGLVNAACDFITSFGIREDYIIFNMCDSVNERIDMIKKYISAPEEYMWMYSYGLCHVEFLDIGIENLNIFN